MIRRDGLAPPPAPRALARVGREARARRRDTPPPVARVDHPEERGRPVRLQPAKSENGLDPAAQRLRDLLRSPVRATWRSGAPI